MRGVEMEGVVMEARLSNTMQTAVHRHRQYCEDFLPAGEMWAMALTMANASSGLWMNLAYYIEDEYSLLLSFKLDS